MKPYFGYHGNVVPSAIAQQCGASYMGMLLILELRMNNVDLMPTSVDFSYHRLMMLGITR